MAGKSPINGHLKRNPSINRAFSCIFIEMFDYPREVVAVSASFRTLFLGDWLATLCVCQVCEGYGINPDES